MSEEELDKKIQDLIDKSERMMSTSTEFIGTNIKVFMSDDDKKVLLDFISLCLDLKRDYNKEKCKTEALEKQHEYDMQMIDEVKGQAVEWANELEKEKEKNKSLKKQIKAMQEYYKNADFIFKDKIREIVIPTPDNPILLEIQQSEFYAKILKILEENNV